MKAFDFNKMADAWPAPIVARHNVDKFSGGLLHPRTLANLDCLGQGPEKIILGSRIYYDKHDLVAWMSKRFAAKVISEQRKKFPKPHRTTASQQKNHELTL